MSNSLGYVLDSDWYWRVFERNPRFTVDAGAVAARDFVRPLARLLKEQLVIEQIVVDRDGEGVRFLIGEREVAIHCRELRLEAFVEKINEALRDAKVGLEFAIVESQRYELRGVLRPAGTAGPRLARGTLRP